MRNRNLILFLTVLVAMTLAAGCGSMRQATKAEVDQLNAVGGKISKAEGMDAKTCAPKELAVAQAELEGARHEATESWEDAKSYIGKADKAADALLAKIQKCEDAKKIPMITFLAEPPTVAPGKCSTLKWSTENVTKLQFGPDEKESPEVPLIGSKEVCPKETTEYQLTGTGPGGSNYEFATVTVGEPPPPPPPPAPAPEPMAAPAPVPLVMPAPATVIDKTELRINFDTNKAIIRKGDAAEMQKAVDFVKKYPDSKVAVVGFTDSRGSDKHNQKLSEQRADAVKNYLVEKGAVKPDQITSEGKGEADPVGDNKTKKGQFMNRRVEVRILSK